MGGPKCGLKPDNDIICGEMTKVCRGSLLLSVADLPTFADCAKMEALNVPEATQRTSKGMLVRVASTCGNIQVFECWWSA